MTTKQTLRNCSAAGLILLTACFSEPKQVRLRPVELRPVSLGPNGSLSKDSAHALSVADKWSVYSDRRWDDLHELALGSFSLRSGRFLIARSVTGGGTGYRQTSYVVVPQVQTAAPPPEWVALETERWTSPTGLVHRSFRIRGCLFVDSDSSLAYAVVADSGGTDILREYEQGSPPRDSITVRPGTYVLHAGGREFRRAAPVDSVATKDCQRQLSQARDDE